MRHLYEKKRFTHQNLQYSASIKKTFDHLLNENPTCSHCVNSNYATPYKLN